MCVLTHGIKTSAAAAAIVIIAFKSERNMYARSDV
jgi:hypothetical protein